ncbi:protein of unknown function (plasmid) [Thermococcus nautili]|uniref:hypothetical protein n=1 Tax=Thermococcus nautili TaxID=195522 RepID=UPI002553A238|nr:hypothetical protein [Thermococcus nautili]CAI1494186.1 protein of unknown function [Thermococcus nautili]
MIPASELGIAVVETLTQKKPIDETLPYIYTLLDWIDTEASYFSNPELIPLMTENVRNLLRFAKSKDRLERIFAISYLPVQLEALRILLRDPVKVDLIAPFWELSIETAQKLNTPALLSFTEVAIKKAGNSRLWLGKEYKVRSMAVTLNGVRIPIWRVTHAKKI